MDDASLVQKCLAGDQEAFRTLVERFKARVFNRCYLLVGSAADAEDLAQETFVRTYRYLNKYDSKYPFGAWILTIAKNLAINFRRRPDGYKVPLVPLSERSDLEEPAAIGADPEKLVEQAMNMRAVREAIMEVQEEFREVLAMRYVNELSYQEIADQLRLPMGTVKSRIFNGRDRLIQLLQRKGVVAAR